MVIKKFLNDGTKKVPIDGTKKVPQWWYIKSSLMMKLKRFSYDGPKDVLTKGLKGSFIKGLKGALIKGLKNT